MAMWRVFFQVFRQIKQKTAFFVQAHNRLVKRGEQQQYCQTLISLELTFAPEELKSK